jgi:hypothetical protein
MHQQLTTMLFPSASTIEIHFIPDRPYLFFIPFIQKLIGTRIL